MMKTTRPVGRNVWGSPRAHPSGLPAYRQLACLRTMEVPGFFIVFVLVAIGVAVFGFYSRGRRLQAARTFASSSGLEFATGDPLRILRLPHRLFARGDSRQIDVTVHGELDGDRLIFCDYTYTEVHRDAEGRTHQTSHPLSLVVLPLRGALPTIQIFPEGVGRRFLNAIGLGNDVQFESEEFNKRFTVLSPSRDFAFTLIDQPMMDWLTREARGMTIELSEVHIVIAVDRIDWTAMSGLAAKAIDFRDRFSPLVWELYQGRA